MLRREKKRFMLESEGIVHLRKPPSTSTTKQQEQPFLPSFLTDVRPLHKQRTGAGTCKLSAPFFPAQKKELLHASLTVPLPFHSLFPTPVFFHLARNWLLLFSAPYYPFFPLLFFLSIPSLLLLLRVCIVGWGDLNSSYLSYSSSPDTPESALAGA